jgi:hypothetical protein
MTMNDRKKKENRYKKGKRITNHAVGVSGWNGHGHPPSNSLQEFLSIFIDLKGERKERERKRERRRR